MSNAMSKHDKKQAVIFGIIFALLVIIIAYLYPLFDYLLPWNKQTIRGSIPYTALSLEEAIGQSETIVSGKVVKIEPNQYDEYNDVAYALISFEVDKVLHGDESLEGKVIHTAQPGGTYRNITYVFPAGTKFNLNEEDILLLNSYSNLTGMPYSKLIKLDDGRYLSYDQKAYTVDELASMIDEAFD